MTCETVAVETPASRATSLIRGVFEGLSSMIGYYLLTVGGSILQAVKIPEFLEVNRLTSFLRTSKKANHAKSPEIYGRLFVCRLADSNGGKIRLRSIQLLQKLAYGHISDRRGDPGARHLA